MKKTIVVTGGSDGLGEALVRELSKNYRVVILARNKEKLEIIANEVACDYYVCDVSNYEQVSKAIQLILNKYQRIDILINNAGVWTYGPVEFNDISTIQQVIDVNLLGVIYVTKAVIPSMKNRKSGFIININSQSGISAKAERAIYTASKWGVTGFTKAIEEELQKYHIKVTDIFPGRLKTELFQKKGIRKPPSGLNVSAVVKTICFLLELSSEVVIPELSIKHIEY